MQHRTCADPYFFVMGMGWGSMPDSNVVFFSHQLFIAYRGSNRLSMVLFERKL